MRTATTALMLLCALGWAPHQVLAQSTSYVLDSERSSVQFLAGSTLHDFTGTAKIKEGWLKTDPRRFEDAAEGEIIIPVSDLTTDNRKRDRAMQNMFQIDQYPKIRFTVTGITPLADQAQAEMGSRYRLDGQLRIRDIEQPIAIDVIAMISSERIEASGEVALTTTQFDLKPPSVLGMIRVHKDLVVRFTSVWKRRP